MAFSLKSSLCFFLLIFAAGLPACVREDNLEIAAPVLTASPANISTLSPTSTDPAIPITGDDEARPESAPVINDVQFPGNLPAGSSGEIGKVHFSDPDGDIFAVQFTCTECGCMDFEYFAFDPISVLSGGDIYNGTFSFQQSCSKCAGSQDYPVIMEVQLFDQAGNASLPAEYRFTCQ